MLDGVGGAADVANRKGCGASRKPVAGILNKRPSSIRCRPAGVRTKTSNISKVGQRPTADPPSRSQSGLATAARIREAASELFFQSGYHGTTMREIASASGVRAGSVYNHFQNKEDLLYRIAFGTMDEMVVGGSAAVGDGNTPTEKLHAFVTFHIAYCIERRFQARVADDFIHVLAEEARASVVARRDEYEAILRGILRAGIDEDGWVVADVAVVTFALVTMLTDVRLWFRPDGRLALSDVIQIYSDLAFRSVGGTGSTT
jgi:AcrR family transcriptional regulator